jgi:ribosomal protein L19
VSTKVGKTLQAKVSSVGTRSLWTKVEVKDPARKSYQIYAGLVLRNQSFSTPIMKFAKKGTYVVTIYLGTSKKVITVKVA